jgi:hypothetical protein
VAAGIAAAGAETATGAGTSSLAPEAAPMAADFGSTGAFSRSSSGALTTGAGLAATGAVATAGATTAESFAFGTTLFLTTLTFLVFNSVLPVVGLASGTVYSSSSTTGMTSCVVF